MPEKLLRQNNQSLDAIGNLIIIIHCLVAVSESSQSRCCCLSVCSILHCYRASVLHHILHYQHPDTPTSCLKHTPQPNDSLQLLTAVTQHLTTLFHKSSATPPPPLTTPPTLTHTHSYRPRHSNAPTRHTATPTPTTHSLVHIPPSLVTSTATTNVTQCHSSISAHSIQHSILSSHRLG